MEDTRKRLLDSAGIYFASSVREKALEVLAANLDKFEKAVRDDAKKTKKADKEETK